MRSTFRRSFVAASAMAAAALLAWPPLASAQTGQGPKGGDRPCLVDVKRLCADAVGPAAKLACLEQHRAELRPVCARHMEQARAQARARTEALRKACDADLKKFCAEVTPGQGALMQCLHQHAADLTQGCRDALPPEAPSDPGNS